MLLLELSVTIECGHSRIRERMCAAMVINDDCFAFIVPELPLLGYTVQRKCVVFVASKAYKPV